MKDFFIALFIAALAVVSCSSEKESDGLSGRYVGTQNFGIGQVSSSMVLTIRQQGSSITGAVTPPFQTDTVPLLNGRIEGNAFRFDANHQGITFHYEGIVQQQRLQGNYQPLGCVMQSSGQPCLTDSDGSFNVQKQP